MNLTADISNILSLLPPELASQLAFLVPQEWTASVIALIACQFLVLAGDIYMANTKSERRVLITVLAYNIVSVAMYALNLDWATMWVCVLLSVRSVIYLFRIRLHHLIAIPIAFMVVQALIGVATLASPLQVMTIAASVFSAYYFWFFSTTQMMRVGSFAVDVVWTIYNLLTGLYIAALARLFSACVFGVAIVIHRSEFKKQEKDS